MAKLILNNGTEYSIPRNSWSISDSAFSFIIENKGETREELMEIFSDNDEMEFDNDEWRITLKHYTKVGQIADLIGYPIDGSSKDAFNICIFFVMPAPKVVDDEPDIQ